MKSGKIAALATLLRVAANNAEIIARRLADFESALANSARRRESLEQRARAEEEAAHAMGAPGLVHLALYRIRASAERAELRQEQQNLVDEIEGLRRALAEAFSEQAKLEHLSERAQSAAARQRRRTDAATLDEAARLGMARKALP